MSGWMKCEEQMPMPGQLVAVWRNWGEGFGYYLDSIYEGCWYDVEEWCQHAECVGHPVRQPVTSHWAPLPEPPTE